MIELASRIAFNTASVRENATITFLRSMVLTGNSHSERFHAVFLDCDRSYLGDAPMGQGFPGCLSLRMRDLFAKALSLSATEILIAHNHPSGQCRPSENDIVSTKRLKSVAEALDIELLDHLIFTQDAVYSMRAGGNL